MPTVLDLFAGAGGATLGLHAAGLDHAGACEIQRDQCATMEFGTGGGLFARASAAWGSSPPLRVYQLPIQQLDPPRADWWWASPPCQAFSSAGKRLGAGDPRNGWPWLFDALDRARAAGKGPRWLLCENVRGMLTHDSTGCSSTCRGCYFELVLEEARARFDYVGWWLLDAADYGVPQHRRRVILVCGPRPVDAPSPTHSAEALAWARGDGEGDDYAERYVRWVVDGVHPGAGPDGLLPHVPMRVALGLGFDGRVLVETGQRTTGADGSRAPYQSSVDRPAPTVRVGNATGVLSLVDDEVDVADEQVEEGRPPWWHRASHPDEPSRAVGSRGNAAILLDQPAPSVTATEVKGARPYRNGEHGGPARPSDVMLWAGTGRRRLTVAECAVLQDFPPDWPFQGDATSQYEQVGNAVPPTLARVVAEAVLAAERR